MISNCIQRINLKSRIGSLPLCLMSSPRNIQFWIITTPLNSFPQTLSFVPLLRRPVYSVVSSSSVRPDVILQLMSRVQWDIKEVRSQHSQYVDVMLRVSSMVLMKMHGVHFYDKKLWFAWADRVSVNIDKLNSAHVDFEVKSQLTSIIEFHAIFTTVYVSVARGIF